MTTVDDVAELVDRLAMIFACCHPSLAEPAKVVLTLYAAAGLTTAAIAAARSMHSGTGWPVTTCGTPPVPTC